MKKSFIVLALVVPQAVSAHSGRTDQLGCHHDRKTWEYHCHEGSTFHEASPHLERTARELIRRRRREAVREQLEEIRSRRRGGLVPTEREPYGAPRLRQPRTARSFRSSREEAQVIRVIDGDTFEVRLADGTFDTVRIVGIDAPEETRRGKPPECYARQASSRLKRLLARRAVRLKLAGAHNRDRYDRLLRYVQLNTRDVGTLMLMEGLVYAYDAFPHALLEQYKGIEQWARRERVGLWGRCR